MKKKQMEELKGIAVIQTGYTFRAELAVLPPDPSDTKVSKVGFVVQMRDIDNNGRIKPESLVPVDLEYMNVRESAFLEVGDIVFKSRGVAHPVTFFDPDTVSGGIRFRDWNIDPAAAVRFILASPLYRIRVTNPGVCPEYLFRLLQTARYRKELDRMAVGTFLPMVKLNDLAHLEVMVPPMEIQRDIARLSALAETEQKLLAEFSETRRRYIEAVIAEHIECKVGER